MRLPSVLIVEEGGRGGVATYASELAAALARVGCDVHVVTARDHQFPAAPGLIMHRVFPYVRGRGMMGRIVRRLRLSRLVNGITHLLANIVLLRLARACDIVHIQEGEWPPLSAVQAVMMRWTGRPVIQTEHNTFDRGARSHPCARNVIRGCAARIVVHSQYDRRMLPPDLWPKVEVIPHGEFSPLANGRAAPDPAVARDDLGISDDGLVVLLFGQLRPDKGIRDLLLASREVKGVTVLLAGRDEGGLAGVQELLTDDRLKGRVRVRPGFVADADVHRLFAAADVVVLPYERASASGVLMLAYGYARPVAAYPIGGLPEYVVEGVTGWICERRDPSALAATFCAILSSGRSECRTRGEAGQRLSRERFGWDSIARRTTELYGDVLSGVVR